MKLKYNREDDILIVETDSEGTLDHAEQTGSMIAHFSSENQLLFLEILDASEFISSLVKVAVRGQDSKLPLTATG
jgi:hypothetical protein